MRTRNQRDFFENTRDLKPGRLTHGGHATKGKRKLGRPLDARKPLHLVLKSEEAKGKLSFLAAKNQPVIEKILRDRARQFGIKLHDKANVGNHIHLTLSFSKRTLFQRFLKTITALIARHVTGARKGKPFGKRFWTHTAFTRVIVGRRAFKTQRTYVMKNQIEARYGWIARLEYEHAERLARKTGRPIEEILEAPG